MRVRAGRLHVGAVPSMPLQRTQTRLACTVSAAQCARTRHRINYTFNSSLCPNLLGLAWFLRLIMVLSRTTGTHLVLNN